MPTTRIEILYRRLFPQVRSLCRRLLVDPAAAEDAAQEVFLRIMRHIDRAPRDAGVRPWALEVTLRYCLNQLRDQKRHTAVFQALPALPDIAIERAILDRDSLLHLFARIPKRLHATALLYHGGGFTQGEVARMLGISRRTVIYRLDQFEAQARKFLRAPPLQGGRRRR